MTTATKQLSPNDLKGFTGTTQWYKHSFNQRFFYTDGIRHFAQNAGGGAYWFLDIAATEIFDLHKAKDEYFLAVKFQVKNGKGVINVTDGNEVLIFTKLIDFTDCPDGLWEFFQILEDDKSIMLVTSEY